jgi:hypothetical protein
VDAVAAVVPSSAAIAMTEPSRCVTPGLCCKDVARRHLRDIDDLENADVGDLACRAVVHAVSREEIFRLPDDLTHAGGIR